MRHAHDELLKLIEQHVGLRLEDGSRIRSRQRGQPPIILSVGGRGTGKTAFLAKLADGYGNKAPRVLVDISKSEYSLPDHGRPPGDMPLPQLLRDLIFDLEPHVRGNGGRISFPRLSAALVAIESWRADWNDNTTVTPDQALEELRARRDAIAKIAPRETADNRVMERWITDVIASLAGGAAPYPVGVLIRATVNVFLARILSIRGRDPVDWHGHFDPRGPSDGYHALISLGRNFSAGNDPRAELRLVGAFLADLRAAYGGPGVLSARAASPLALLDNVAANPVGNRFLELVLECRAQPGAGQDRLVVVGTAPEGYQLTHVPMRPDGATAQQASAVTAGTVRRMALAPVTESDVRYMLDGADPRLLPRDLARLIVRLTGGMPLAADAIARAVTLAAPADGSGTQQVQGSKLLDLTVPGPDNASVAAYVLQRLIQQDQWRNRLTLLSCAQDRDEARKLADTYLPGNPARSYVDLGERILRASGWADGNGRFFVSDPFMRVLLLHQLRAAGTTGAQAHETLRDLRGRGSAGALAKGEPLRFYHCLCLGHVDDVGYVARRLDESFSDQRVEDWLTAIVRIAVAPCGARTDTRRVAALGARDDPSHDDIRRSVWRLLNAAWYLHDPLVAPDGEVIDQLGAELQFLAGKHPHGNRVLTVAAREWPARLRDWRQDWNPTI